MVSVTTLTSLFVMSVCIYLKVSCKSIEAINKTIDGLTEPANELPKENNFNEGKSVNTIPNMRTRRSVMTVNTHRDVTSLVDGLKANGDMLENLTNGVANLVQSAAEQVIGYTAVTKRLEEINSGLVHRLEQMYPLFISMFITLTDVALSTSPRLSIQKEQAVDLSNYFRQNITTEIERNVFDKNLYSVFQWYIDFTQYNFSSCVSIRNAGFILNGVYPMKVSDATQSLNVYCDQETDGGGWLVVQRREDGSEDFQRSWSDYKQGFGDVTREFWLGNDYLHQLTNTKQELRIDIMDFEGNTAYVEYPSFTVGPESEYYKMTVGGYSGTAGNSMGPDSGGRFYVVGQGNSCVDGHKGPWWRVSCLFSNLNGIYSSTGNSNGGTHLSWWKWKEYYHPLQKVEIKIRPST